MHYEFCLNKIYPLCDEVLKLSNGSLLFFVRLSLELHLSTNTEGRQDLISSGFPIKRLNILTSSQSHEM